MNSQQYENVKSYITKLIPSAAADVYSYILTNAASLWQDKLEAI
jgi:hypothetical protein